MPRDLTAETAQDEARRQIQICNACRYCEGYCAVFPAMFRERDFATGDISHLASLCHNCRGCYYACQYTEPHEFALNLPGALADLRAEDWERYAWPSGPARVFQRHGVATAGTLILGLALLFWAVAAWTPKSGDGFYAYLSHSAMVALFAPAFVLPLVAMAMGVRLFWREIGGTSIRWSDLRAAGRGTARMTNLRGGHGEGCNFEDEDRFTQARRHAHQAVMWGFLLCFASTSSGTVLHYVADWPAPYPWWSPPKLLGLPGGVLLTLGAVALAWLKTKADPRLGARDHWGGEMAFTLLLGVTGASGLALYAATGSAWVPGLLALHLGAVLTLFLTMPYSKMVHGAYRFAALLREAQKQDPPL